jgi:cysteine sulfinate desulfinase/cysteine desulfurase-like protein
MSMSGELETALIVAKNIEATMRCLKLRRNLTLSTGSACTCTAVSQ